MLIAITHLANGEDAGGLGKIGPEVLANVLDGVDAHAIETVCADDVLDEVVELANDRVVLRVDIIQRKGLVAEPALLDLRLVALVLDPALRVERRGARDGREAVVVKVLAAASEATRTSMSATASPQKQPRRTGSPPRQP